MNDANDTKVELNQASPSDLAELPGIGEKLAQKIVDYREENQAFSEVAGLAAVPGISEQMAGELGDYLTVRMPEAESTPAQAEPREQKGQAKKQATAKNTSRSKSKSQKSAPQLPELRTAARSGDVKKVKALLDSGADGCDKFALLWASEEGHDQVVAELIKAGVDVDSRSAAGGPNALSLAAQNGHLQVVHMLVEAGADVNAQAMQGWTPLMKAAFFGHDEIVKSLIEAGAEIRIRDANGQTAIDHARQADNHQIVGVLL
jgi:competence ComEA-like helix-hairpin-helix protein